jgi:hypothetical protein
MAGLVVADEVSRHSKAISFCSAVPIVGAGSAATPLRVLQALRCHQAA